MVLLQLLKQAKKIVEAERPEVWDILEEVIREHPVMLNRAPTLASDWAFRHLSQCLLKARRFSCTRLVCTPYNADFDGDQMAVHVPLSSKHSSKRVL